MSLPRVRYCDHCDAYAYRLPDDPDEDYRDSYQGHDSRLHGAELVLVPVSAVHTAPCPNCPQQNRTEGGTWNPCPTCNGTGQVEAVHYDPHGILT